MRKKLRALASWTETEMDDVMAEVVELREENRSVEDFRDELDIIEACEWIVRLSYSGGEA
jgi:hypothetical protein